MLYDFSEGITEYIEEKSFSIDVIPTENRHPKYPHITVSIKSLSEYMRMIAFLYEFDNSPDDNLAFRGVSDYSFSLSPSLRVYQENENFSYNCDYSIEYKLVDEMLTSRPEEFAGITSDFDLLAKMQHLGLPTRLLDFSLNPLVALYFACQSLSSKTARVLCTRDTSSAYSRKTVDDVCGTHRVIEFAQFYLEDLVHGNDGILRYMVHNREPLMAHPKCISERIQRQSGIFMIFPNTVSDSAWFNLSSRSEGCYHINYATPKGNEILNKIKDCENPYKIYGIASEQDLMGHRFILTPDSFHKLQQCYPSNATEQTFQKRFYVDSDVASIPPKIMAENFCSILIEPEYKRNIMRELDQVNINEAFLFPEPEYTAKRIKNRYLR